jgi:surface antigen
VPTTREPQALIARGVIAALVATMLGLVAPLAPARAGAGDDRRTSGGTTSPVDPDSPLQQWIRDRLAPVTLEQAIRADQRRGRWSTYLCTGYTGCKQAGYPNHGYRAHNGRMYWNMYAGHNCTNYAAYRMVQAGLPNKRPWGSGGNATHWGYKKDRITNRHPFVGAVAWWKAYAPGAGSVGHVAYVEKVISQNKIVISEDSWSGDFHWRRIAKRDGAWPTGFIHFKDQHVRPTQAPRLSGDAKVGQVLQLDRGAWGSNATTSVRWYADGHLLSDTTGNSLRLTPGLLRNRIEVRVRAEKLGYRDGRASTVSTPVRRGQFEMRRGPSVTGGSRVGDVLEVRPGAWSPAPDETRIQWLADDHPIEGATGIRLRLTPGLLRQRISVSTRVRGEGYERAAVRSEPTAKIRRGHIRLDSAYALTGKALVGRELEVAAGAVTPSAVTASYQWLRGTHPIRGATGRRYTTGAHDLGKTLALRVTLRSPGYRSRTLLITDDAVVRTRPHLAWEAVGKDHKAVVKVSLSALGLDRVRGPVTVTVGRTSLTQRLEQGAARLVFRHLDPGTHKVTVSYPGRGDLVLPAGAVGSVHVRRH